MSIFNQFKELLLLIKKKQDISISDGTFQASKHLAKNLMNHCQALKDVKFEYKTFIKLLISCWKLNIFIFGIVFIFTLASSILSIFAINLNDFIIQSSTKSNQISQIFKILMILFAYKMFENLVDQIGSYLTMNNSFRIYSSLYYNFIKRKSLLTGGVLNIIQDDIQKLQYFAYYLVNICIIPFLIIVLSIMLILSLNSGIQQILVGFLLVLLIFLYLMLARVIFQVNQKFMSKKDSRLQMCIDRQLIEKMFQQRKIQVYQIRKFMWVQTIIKWLTQSIFFLLYIVIFLINFENNAKNDKYYQLMLLGMIKTPMQTMCFIFYSFSSTINSLKRICLNIQQSQQNPPSKTQNFQPNNFNTNQNLNQSLLSSSSLQKQQNDSIINTQISSKKILSQTKTKVSQISQNKNQSISKYVSKQRGEIKIKKLFDYINKNTTFGLKLFILFLIVLFFFVKFQRIQITNQIVTSSMTLINWIVLTLPLVIPFLLVFSLIKFFFMISLKLFKSFKTFSTITSTKNNEIHALTLNGEQLNRISGDIQAVDKGISLFLYDLISISFSILASLLYSILKIQQLFYQILISVVILITIFCAIKSNRYFMKSRRQVKRDECRQKSKIIQLLKQNKTIQNCQEMQSNWKRIYMYKNIGIMIQNTYIFILYLQVLIIQLIFVGICLQGNLLTSYSQLGEGQFQARKIMITIILQLDYQLFSLFMSSIHMEIGLVSFERCVNMSLICEPSVQAAIQKQQSQQKLQGHQKSLLSQKNEEENTNEKI